MTENVRDKLPLSNVTESNESDNITFRQPQSTNHSYTERSTEPLNGGRFHVPVRVIIVGLLCLGSFTSSMSRGNMSATIIAMAPQSHNTTTDETNTNNKTINRTRIIGSDYNHFHPPKASIIDFKGLNVVVNYRSAAVAVAINQSIANRTVSIFDSSHDNLDDISSISPYCGYDENGAVVLPIPSSIIASNINDSLDVSLIPEFDWSEHVQDHLKGAFSIGYALTLVISGRLSEQYGGKAVATIGGIFQASLNLLTPWAARRSVWLLAAVRVMLGAAGASLIPSFFCVISRWIPDNEKSKAIAALSVGNSLGNICLNLVSGYLCRHGIDGGWPSVFFLTGGLNLIWLILWFVVASDHPFAHRFISRRELRFIARQTNLRNAKRPPPVTAKLYLRMLTSVPVLATIYVKLAHAWFFNLFQSKIPQYMIAVLGMTIEQTSMWNTLFHFVLFLPTLISGCLADYAINAKCCHSKTCIRKTFEVISCSGMFISMLLLARSQCMRGFFILVMAGGVASSGISTGGSSTVVVDLTTDYSASLIAVMSTIAMLFGFVTPHLITKILNKKSHSIEPWRDVFLATAGIIASGGIVFLAFASAKNQNWECNDEDANNNDRNSEATKTNERINSVTDNDDDDDDVSELASALSTTNSTTTAATVDDDNEANNFDDFN